MLKEIKETVKAFEEMFNLRLGAKKNKIKLEIEEKGSNYLLAWKVKNVGASLEFEKTLNIVDVLKMIEKQIQGTINEQYLNS